MRVANLEDLQNNDEVAFIFPVDESGHYQTVMGQYKSFKDDRSDDHTTAVYLNNTVELEFDALDGTRISKDTSTILNIYISEDDRDSVTIFLITRNGKPVTE